MKFKVGDKVLITAGKDKGKKSVITRVLPKVNKVIVKDINVYARHLRKFQGQAGQVIRKERPLPLSKIAIINDKGQADRIKYKKLKNGTKERIFTKTQKAVPYKPEVEEKTPTILDKKK